MTNFPISLPADFITALNANFASMDAAIEALAGSYTATDLAALKALTTRPLSVVVRTGKAAGVWEWESGSATTADDATVVQCTAGDPGRYKRIFDGPPNVIWWGADLTGVADSAPAFLSAAQAFPGRTIYVPAGTYLWGTAIQFDMPVLFVGDGWNERNQGAGSTSGSNARDGSWILVTDSGISPILFTLGAGGLSGFHNIAFEQTHPAPGGGWAPTDYPALITIDGVGGTLSFDNIYLYAINKAFSIPHLIGVDGRPTFGNIKGHVFSYFFEADVVLDIVWFNTVHLWPYWSNDSNVTDWTLANGVCFHLKRVDGLECTSFFSNGYKAGVHFDIGVSDFPGPAVNVNFHSAYCEFGKYAVWVTGAGTAAFFGRLTTHGTATASQGIRDETEDSVIRVGHLNTQKAGGSAVAQTSTSGGTKLMIGSMFFQDVDDDNSGAFVFTQAGTTTTHVIDIATQPVTGHLNHFAGYVSRAPTSIFIVGGQLYPCTVANLPAANLFPYGMRGLVTDTTATTFGSAPVGGGGNILPVVTNLVSWIHG